MSDTSGSEEEQSRLLEAVKGVPTSREIATPTCSAGSSSRITGDRGLVVAEDVQTYLFKKLSEYVERVYEGVDNIWGKPLETAANTGAVKLLADSISAVQQDQPPPPEPRARDRRRRSSTTSTDSDEEVRLKEAAIDPKCILGGATRKNRPPSK